MKTRALVLVCGWLLIAQSVAGQQERVSWLKEHSVPLRTLAADSSGFDDLEPLVPLLAGVRVVQLAELSHGDGNGSAARVRLIRFLHQRLGFSVVVWEAGFYEAERMNTLLAADVPIGYVPEAALWWFWSESAQIAPLFDYARQTLRTSAPLRMAGFDLQFTGGVPALLERLREVPQWFERAGRPLPAVLRASLDSTRLRLARTGGSQTEAARDTLLERATELVAHFERNAAEMRAAHGALPAARIERVLRNMIEYRTMLRLYSTPQSDSAGELHAFVASYNARDRANAENLLWLLEEGHRGAKVIVWSHNVHAAHTRLSGRFDALYATDAPDRLESTGRLLKTRLGAELYSIGTISYEGEWGFPDQPPQPVRKPPAGSLAALLNQTGHAAAVIDLRAARSADHWLMSPLSGTISAQVLDRWYPIVWPQVFDGLLFIRQMTPADRRR